MKTRIIYLFLFINLLEISSNLVYAQHEVGLHAGYGSGFGLGIDYSFEVAPRWRIQTGLGAAFLSTDSQYDNLNSSQILAIPQGLPANSLFYFNTDINRLNEEWKLSFLDIPLMLEFQTKSKQAFYAAAGIKLGIPLSGSYHQTFDRMTTYGFSDYTNQKYADMPELGFSTYNNGSSDGDLNLSLLSIAAVKMGMKWSVAKNVRLITGLYLDYGLNDSWKNDTKLIEYQASGQHKLNSASDSYSFLAYGIELGISIRFGGSQKTKNRQSIEEILPIVIAPEIVNTIPLEKITIPLDTVVGVTDVADNPKSDEYDVLILLQPVNRYIRNQVNPSRFQLDLLEEKVPVLLANSDIHILIEGHTDSDEANKAGLGIQRAETAKKYLVSRGIASECIQIVDKGNCCPVTFDQNEEEKGKNRRIEFLLIP